MKARSCRFESYSTYGGNGEKLGDAGIVEILDWAIEAALDGKGHFPAISWEGRFFPSPPMNRVHKIMIGYDAWSNFFTCWNHYLWYWIFSNCPRCGR